MPKVTKNKRPKIPTNIQIGCAGCGQLKKNSEFYISYNPIHVKGRIPYCKKCLKDMISDEYGNVKIDNLKSTLQVIDKPFIWDLWKISLEDKNDTFGTYMKNLALKQNRDLSWKDSMFHPQINNEISYKQVDIVENESLLKQSDFAVTDEIIDKWGYGYTNEEYYYFEKKWNKLIDNYGEKTSLHNEGLVTYIRFRVKEELATAKGNVKDAKDWQQMAKDAATAAKINVSQLSKSDISGGVELLPQLFEAVESEVGIIPIMPQVKEQPYDDVDLIIWTIINYNRRLEDKPRIAYKDIWQFYDEMLEEHFKQKGYSDEMIKNEKRKRNNVFRDLSEIYIEPVYEEGDG